MHRGRLTSRDLQIHIITGERGPQTGAGIVQDIDDADLNREDPMEFGGSAQLFEGQSAQDIIAASEAQCAGLDSAAALGTPMDMDSLCDGNDQDSKARLGYGPRRIGNGR